MPARKKLPSSPLTTSTPPDRTLAIVAIVAIVAVVGIVGEKLFYGKVTPRTVEVLSQQADPSTGTKEQKK